MSDINFIDGTALDATSFGETVDGYWRPVAYSGSYGTNGFHLEFDGAVTDSSGNGNDWTANNISAHDYVPDSPTNNFAVLNTLDKNSAATLSEGNLRVVTGGAQFGLTKASMKMSSGKWYFEYLDVSGTYHQLGISTEDEVVSGITNGSLVGKESGYGYRGDTGVVLHENSTAATYATYTDGDVIGVAYDLDNGSISFYKNGSSQGTISSVDTSLLYAPAVCDRSGNHTSTGIFNFGQDSTFAGNTTAGGNTDANGIGDFKYAVPSGGYLALCTSSLPEPSILDASEHFNTVLYIGNSTDNTSISGVGFQPDLVWAKERSSTSYHLLTDAVRTAGQMLYSNEPDAEFAGNDIKSFDSDGFTVSSSAASNQSSQTYVAWNWKAGTAFSNSAGSNGATIASSGSVNTDAGFSIVSYTGNTTTNINFTVGHGLGKKPDLIIIKNRDWASNTKGWPVWHSAISTGAVYLDDPDLSQAAAFNSFFGAQPTSDVFNVRADTSVGTGNRYRTFGRTDNYIAYCFANSDILKAGSYTGNGSSDGPFVFTGGRPVWVMLKETDGAGNWFIWDEARDTYNESLRYLRPNLSNAEGTGTIGVAGVDFVSNGFKLRATSTAINQLNRNYIYLAFVQPFKYANAR
jgi:hypothetical protein